jgi:N,N'-diacetyllegionaminate synthase
LIQIIAEAGVNHNGSLEMAKGLVDEALRAGADMIKFQTFQADRLLVRSCPKAEYQQVFTEADESQFDMLRRLELSRRDFVELIHHCRERQITFLSSPFDEESIDFLVGQGVPALKVPSGELTNLPYLRHLAGCQLPVYLSSGMATLGEIEWALEIMEREGLSRNLITLLHCTSEYPAPFPEVNLRAMVNMKLALGIATGYSDHTSGIEIAVAAAALGAKVIEKHFTLDHSLPGPDHRASLDPDEFHKLVKAVRCVEEALGDGVKRPTPREEKNLLVARRSIVAARPIAAGELLSTGNLTCKRPGTGISPRFWDEILGRVADRSYAPDEMIEWDGFYELRINGKRR